LLTHEAKVWRYIGGAILHGIVTSHAAELLIGRDGKASPIHALAWIHTARARRANFGLLVSPQPNMTYGINLWCVATPNTVKFIHVTTRHGSRHDIGKQGAHLVFGHGGLR